MEFSSNGPRPSIVSKHRPRPKMSGVKDGTTFTIAAPRVGQPEVNQLNAKVQCGPVAIGVGRWLGRYPSKNLGRDPSQILSRRSSSILSFVQPRPARLLLRISAALSFPSIQLDADREGRSGTKKDSDQSIRQTEHGRLFPLSTKLFCSSIFTPSSSVIYTAPRHPFKSHSTSIDLDFLLPPPKIEESDPERQHNTTLQSHSFVALHC